MTKIAKLENELAEMKEKIEKRKEEFLTKYGNDSFMMLFMANYQPYNWDIHEVRLMEVDDSEIYGKQIRFMIEFEDGSMHHFGIKIK